MKLKIEIKEILKFLDIDTPDFPKYVSPLINLANQYAHGTRPNVVGQMSDLIHEFDGETVAEWDKWYQKKKPYAIKNATEKILKKLQELKNSMNKIDQSMVEEWVRDLVVQKTYAGLRFQEAILEKVAEIKGLNYRLSEPDEESKGIDGYIGNIPISIKPHTYKMEAALPENIEVKIIYYKKIKRYIEIDYGEMQK